jgi:branched-chain amino acid transport system ATP-binding protein
MIDELSLGLAPAVVEQLLEIVRAIHANGTTIILVEQSVNVAMTVADRAVFMEKGEVRFSGPTSELIHRGDILRSVFLAGAGVGSARRRKAPVAYDRQEEAEIVLQLDGVTKSFGGVNALTDVELTLRDGEVLGLIGPNGAGKTTLFDVISGFVLPDRGRVTLLGDDVTSMSPDQRAVLGLQRSFQDAQLFPALTVTENLLVALDRHLQVKNAAMASIRLPNVNRAEWRLGKRAERLIGILNLEPFRDKFVRELSTGSRRLVDLACVLGTDPQVLLLDEPSSGVAQRETEELGPLIQRIKSETAASILIIEHDMPLISNVADELIAMELGTPVVRGTPEFVLNHPRVVEAYLGTSREAIQRSGQLT